MARFPNSLLAVLGSHGCRLLANHFPPIRGDYGLHRRCRRNLFLEIALGPRADVRKFLQHLGPLNELAALSCRFQLFPALCLFCVLSLFCFTPYPQIGQFPDVADCGEEWGNIAPAAEGCLDRFSRKIREHAQEFFADLRSWDYFCVRRRQSNLF